MARRRRDLLTPPVAVAPDGDATDRRLMHLAYCSITRLSPQQAAEMSDQERVHWRDGDRLSALIAVRERALRKARVSEEVLSGELCGCYACVARRRSTKTEEPAWDA
jgi:hypothetical protein